MGCFNTQNTPALVTALIIAITRRPTLLGEVELRKLLMQLDDEHAEAVGETAADDGDGEHRAADDPTARIHPDRLADRPRLVRQRRRRRPTPHRPSPIHRRQQLYALPVIIQYGTKLADKISTKITQYISTVHLQSPANHRFRGQFNIFR